MGHALDAIGWAASARSGVTRDIDIAVSVADDPQAEPVLFELSQHWAREE